MFFLTKGNKLQACLSWTIVVNMVLKENESSLLMPDNKMESWQELRIRLKQQNLTTYCEKIM